MCPGPNTKLEGSRERLRPKETESGMRSEGGKWEKVPTEALRPRLATSPCPFRDRTHSFVPSFSGVYGAPAVYQVPLGQSVSVAILEW